MREKNGRSESGRSAEAGCDQSEVYYRTRNLSVYGWEIIGHIVWEQEVMVLGDTIGQIDLSDEVNVWESSYANMGTKAIEVSKERTAASVNDSSTVEFYADEISGIPLAILTFGATEPVTYDLGGDGTISVTEMGYKRYTTVGFQEVEGVHDLYIVFRESDIRLDSIKAV